MSSVSTTPEPNSVEERVIHAVLTQRRHVILQGAGGCGKSWCIMHMLLPANQQRKRPYKIALTAPTGVAAALLGGVTINSWAGLGFGMSNSNDHSRRPGEEPPTVYQMAKKLAGQLFKKPEKVQEIRETDILLIDEISIMADDLFDLLDNVLRIVRSNAYAPFGGIRLVLSGDVLQLAPVQGKFFFHSNAWVELCGGRDPNAPSLIDFFVFERCRRFNNLEWFHVLSRIRVGQMTSADEQLLRKRMISISQEEQMAHLPSITGLRKNVDAENYYRQSQLSLPDYHCRAHDYLLASPFTPLPKKVLELMENHFKATTPALITLRVGARVMLKTNLDFDEFYVNGSTGTIVRFDVVPEKKTEERKDSSTPHVVKRVLVQFDPLLPALQAIVNERRAKMAEVNSLIKQTNSLTINVHGKPSSVPTTSTPKDGMDADDEQESDEEDEQPGSDNKSHPVSTINPLEEDRLNRRIWISPFPYKVKFNKQMLGIRRTTIGPFSVQDNEFLNGETDSVLDVPTTGNDDEDAKLQNLANAKGTSAEVVRAQIPLVLAWSITGHKAQGATFPSPIKIDLGRESIFAEGQAYVMLSRCPSIEGVYLTRFHPAKIRANVDALNFVNTIQGGN